MNLGISACLLGHCIRYDANHSNNPYLRDKLGQYVTWVPVCPEFESGLPVPREPLHLYTEKEQIHLITTKTGTDLTTRIKQWSLKWSSLLKTLDLSGFVFKAKSPCCGLNRIKISRLDPNNFLWGTGLFAELFQKINPLCPVIDDGCLHDIYLRDRFLKQIFTINRLRQCLLADSQIKFIKFHTSHKYLFLSLSPFLEKKLGQIAAHPTKSNLYQYQTLMFEILSKKLSTNKNLFVFQRFFSQFKKRLSAQEHSELLLVLDLYRKKLIPYYSVLLLFKQYAQRFKNQYILNQYIFEPYPLELLQINPQHPAYL